MRGSWLAAIALLGVAPGVSADEIVVEGLSDGDQPVVQQILGELQDRLGSVRIYRPSKRESVADFERRFPTAKVTAIDDRHSLFSRKGSGPRLTPDQRRLLQVLRKDGSDASLLSLVPESLVRRAIGTGYGKADGFVRDGSLRLPVSEETSLDLSVSKLETLANRTIWRGDVTGGLGRRDGSPASGDAVLGEVTGKLTQGERSAAAGSATLIVEGRDIAGSIRVGHQLYIVRPLGSGLHAVIHRDVRSLPPDHASDANDPSDDGAPGPPDDPADATAQPPDDPRPDGDSGGRIDLLVLYTQQVADAYANEAVQAELIDLAIDETNQSFANSGIDGVTVNLVHAAKVDYDVAALYPDATFSKTDPTGPQRWLSHIHRFSGKGDGYLDEVHELRDAHAADIAILILDDASQCGKAGQVKADEASAFAVVHHTCALGYYSFGHEIGHILGADHDVVDRPTNRAYAHGHGHLHGTSWRSIMGIGAGCEKCPREQRWSSSEVLLDQEPTGSADREDNARIFRDRAVTVAGFRTAVEEPEEAPPAPPGQPILLQP